VRSEEVRNMSDTAVVVSVGRDRTEGDGRTHPMSASEWRTFRDEVYVTVQRFSPGDRPYFDGIGNGWSPTWGTEDTYTVIAAAPDLEGWDRLKDELGRIGKHYGQEAVAVTVGATIFV
jgi:hypothetical protein